MKALGKKKTAQNGTLVAFACDCISVCKSLASCNCATDITMRDTNRAFVDSGINQ